MNWLQNRLRAAKQYLQPQAGKVRGIDIVREFGKQGGFAPGIKEVAKSIPIDVTRFGISAFEAPKSIATGKATGKFYNTPFGRINSFQSEAQNRVRRGDPMWKAIGNPATETILAGSDVGSVASPLLKFAGRRMAGEAGAIARDLSKNVINKRIIPGKTESIPGHWNVGRNERIFNNVMHKLDQGNRYSGKQFISARDFLGDPQYAMNTERFIPEQTIQRTPDRQVIEFMNPESKVFEYLKNLIKNNLK
jgi:hypothetical protein